MHRPVELTSGVATRSPPGGAPPGCPYYVDFICRERKLIVEVDGGTHGEDHEIAADQQRTEALTRMGYRVKRATNTDVYDNLPGVLDALLAALEGRSR